MFDVGKKCSVWARPGQKVMVAADLLHTEVIGVGRQELFDIHRPNASIEVSQISFLHDVPHLQPQALRQHVETWPRRDRGPLEAERWGFLADPHYRASCDTPFTLVAVGSQGDYLGAISLLKADFNAPRYVNDMTKSPWCSGLVVRPDLRGKKISLLLHYELLRLAARMGIETLWGRTEDRPYPTLGVYMKHFNWRLVDIVEPHENAPNSKKERRYVMRWDADSVRFVD